MFDEEMITKYRYIILLLGTAVSFVLGFVVAFALAKLCGVMAVKAVINIAKYETIGSWAGVPFLVGAWHHKGIAVNFEYNITERKLKCYRIN